ncbi:MAG: VapC toxin family PIN domain ribonuclease, partial [Pseudomonadota bacterium]|nr:VapC toxin family PIN domain ribonuclease [Pseudomonadota bacterium]
HETAHVWFAKHGHRAWATCPLTENGLVRIVGDSRYPNSLGTPTVAARILARMRALPGHTFWADDVSLLDDRRVDSTRLLHSRQITDSYLLALAVAHGGKLATLDRKLVADAVAGGAAALHAI